jgi:hypothetical protein
MGLVEPSACSDVFGMELSIELRLTEIARRPELGAVGTRSREAATSLVGQRRHVTRPAIA